jgi:hypothetical protein
VIGDLNDYGGDFRCEPQTQGTCIGNISYEYGDDDGLVKIDLTSFELEPDSTEYLVVTMGDCLVTSYTFGGGVEQTSGTFRASFMDNGDGTLALTSHIATGGQQVSTIIQNMSGSMLVTGYDFLDDSAE